MKIQFLTEADITESVENQVKLLFSELSDVPALSIRSLLGKENPPHIAVCLEQEKIIGMATMAIYEVISGKKAWVEDVVVASEHRKKGIGEQLMKALIEKGKSLEINTILLYSNPKREAAHKLYKRLGFTEKGSTLFSFNIS